MMKFLFVLALGVGIGYHLGFKDARAHETTVVTRVLERVGGSNRGKYRTDVDKQMEMAEKR